MKTFKQIREDNLLPLYMTPGKFETGNLLPVMEEKLLVANWW